MTEKYEYTSPGTVSKKLKYLSVIVWVSSIISLIAGLINPTQWVIIAAVGWIILWLANVPAEREQCHKYHNKILREIDWEESSYTPTPYPETPKNSIYYGWIEPKIVELTNDKEHTIFVTVHTRGNFSRVDDTPEEYGDKGSVVTGDVEDIVTEVENRMES